MIYEEKNALSEETCNDMISWFDNKTLYGDTGMNYAKVDVQGRKDISLSECQQFGSFKPFYNQINSIIHKHMVHYINEFNKGGGTGFYTITGYKFQKSVEGGGFTAWHSELPVFKPMWEKVRDRFGVWTFYLNDTDTGYTDFMHQKLSIKPETGKLVIWPAYFTHTHRANPDLKEDKYIMTGWLETDYERNRK
tara:strand:+ start:123 stop:701 length:579 start_codon:yes stop_codon:yes gene_type:complete